MNDGRRVAVTGASGLVGRAICARLTREGYSVVRIGRAHRDAAPDVVWNPAAGEIDAAALDGVSAVVHLAGETIGQRWTSSVRRRILESRVDGTSLIARTIAALRAPPAVLISASAVGFYGDRGDETVDERDPRGSGFLADVVQAWEAAAEPARAAGIVVTHSRFGVEIAPDGGMLERQLPIVRLGAGGRIGSGRQWLSWISRTDIARAVAFLVKASLGGPVNVTAPSPVTNEEFTRLLASALHRPAVAAVPAFAIRLAFGQMGEETVLAGQRVVPTRLLDAGFAFEHPMLDQAFRTELGRQERQAP
jgi:uncharacterized protein (TIGR01777 family)